jgi:hypothetical protein
MKFLLIIAHDNTFVPADELVAQIFEWIETMERRGVRVSGAPLRPAAEACTVRVRDSKVRRTAGPFSEAKEQICAYELLECDSMEMAVQAALSHPMASAATIEVRPVWEQLASKQ